MPTILRGSIGARQHAAGPLYRKSPGVKQFAHMTGMIMNSELFLDHPANQGGRPDPTVQTVSHWATVKDVSQLLLLFLRQFRRPTRPIPFQQPLDSLNLITLQPL